MDAIHKHDPFKNGKTTIDCQDYFTTKITTETQVKKAVELCNSYISLNDACGPIDDEDISSFCSLGEEFSNGFLLYSLDRQPLYRKDFPPLTKKYPPKYAVHNRVSLSIWPKDVYHAIALIGCCNMEGSPYSVRNLFVDCLYRSPWSEAEHIAVWCDRVCEAYADSLVNIPDPKIRRIVEFEVAVSQRDLPLQLAFRKEGYFCFDSCAESEEFYFTKIVAPRTQEALRRPSRQGRKRRRRRSSDSP